jgi:hypothetical protein
MWGIFPFGSSLLAILVILIPSKKRQELEDESLLVTDDNLAHGRLVS